MMRWRSGSIAVECASSAPDSASLRDATWSNALWQQCLSRLVRVLSSPSSYRIEIYVKSAESFLWCPSFHGEHFGNIVGFALGLCRWFFPQLAGRIEPWRLSNPETVTSRTTTAMRSRLCPTSLGELSGQRTHASRQRTP
jgi:hypothetical protein